MVTNDKTFGDKIKLFRSQRGWKQELLAEKAGLSQSEISKIESGKIKGGKDTIQKLANALEVPPEVLVRNTSLADLFKQSSLVFFGTNNQGLPISAYFASALTGLSNEQIAEITALDEKVNEICKSYDRYQVALYRPRTVTSPVDNPDVSPQNVYEIDQERVASADIMFLAALFPSLGAGMELQIALQSCSSIILLKKKQQKLSRMVLGCPAIKEIVDFDSLIELDTKIVEALNTLLPTVAEFRSANPQLQETANDFELGKRVLELRKKRGFTQERLARMVGVETSYIELLETKSERIINPSLQILRRIAKALLTSETFLVSGQHGFNSRFSQHFLELSAYAEEVRMPYPAFNQLWSKHVEMNQHDFLVSGVDNRAETGTKKYWKDEYERYEEDKGKTPKLF